MINYVNLELFNQSSIRKDIDMAYDTNKHINNNDVVSGSFSLNESACSSKELKFGSLVSSKMSVKLYNTVEKLMDKELSVSITLNKDSNNPLKIGKYTVKSEKPTSDRLYKQIEAYDGLYEVIHKDVSDWYESLAFPLTQKALRDSFFNYVGLEQVNVTLINDNMVIEKTISTNSLSGKQVLSAICELNGAIGRMNREGKFAYIILNPNPTNRITINKIQGGSGSYEDYECKPISKVQIRQEANDIGAIVGVDGNTYIVQDNFLVYGKSSTDLTNIASNLLSVIRGITYRPFKVKAIYGNPCYEIGDALTVVTKNATFNTYMLNRTLNGINAMSDTIKADGVEVYTENLNSTNAQFQQLKRQTNSLERTVEKTVSQITAIDNEVTELGTRVDEAESTITQTADEIMTEVSKTYATQESVAQSVDNLQQQIDGAIETFTGSAVPTLTNYPANEWTTTAEKDTHIGDLYIVNSSGGDKAGFYYRFEKVGTTYQWTLLKDSEVTKALQDAKEANEKAQAVADNLSANYSTTTEMNSAINQSAENITSTVSKTYETKTQSTANLKTAKSYADSVGSSTLSSANANAQSYANTAESNANANTANLLKSYSTTTQMNSAISQSAESIKSEVSKTYATQSALNTVDGKFANYSTTTQMNSAIEQSATSIKQIVNETYQVKGDYATNTKVSTVEQTANKINWLVKSGTSESNMKLTDTMYSLIADNITLKGNHIQLDGNTTIGSGFKLTADNLDVNSIFAKNITATGTISGATLTGASGNFTKDFSVGVRKVVDESANEIYNNNFTINDSGLELSLTQGVSSIKMLGYLSIGTRITSIYNSNLVQIVSSNGKVKISGKGDSDGISVSFGGTYDNQTYLKSDGTFVTGNLEASNISVSGTITGNLSGNAATATNSDTVDGFHASQTAGSKYTCTVTDSYGYLNLSYISSNTRKNENPSISQVIVTNGNDNYYRKASLSHLKSSLGSMPASDVYSWAKASTKPSYSWNEITSKPSSLPANGGTSEYANKVWTQSHNGSWYINSSWNGTYFITNAKATGGSTLPIWVNNSGYADSAGSANSLSGFTNTTTSATAVDNATQNGHVYVNNTSGIVSQSDGACYVQAYNTAWVHQIYGDYRTGQIAVRGKNNGTWQSWRTVLDSSNYKSYCTPANIGAAASSHTHSYLPLSGGTVTGKTTFSNGLAITSGTENTSMPFFLGIKAFADGGDIQWITASKVVAAIGAASSSHTHNYAGSSSAGGAATTALALASSVVTSSSTGGSFYRYNLGAFKILSGYKTATSYAMTNAYGNGYYANFTIDIPSGVRLSGAHNVVVSTYGGGGLTTAKVTSMSTSQIKGYIFDTKSETQSVAITFVMFGS